MLFDNVVSDVSLEAFSQLLDGAFLSLLRGRLFLTSKSIGERAVFFVGFLLIVLLLHVEYSATIPFLLLGMRHASIIGRRPVLLRTEEALLRWHGKKAIFFLDSASTAEIESNVAWRLLPRTEWHKQVGTCLLGNTILFYIDRNVRDTIMMYFQSKSDLQSFCGFCLLRSIVYRPSVLSYYYVTYWIILHFEKCVYSTKSL